MPTFTMVDLETMGNCTDAAICSIGAVKFDPDTDSSTDTEFYAHINLQSAQDDGGRIDAVTVLWWMAFKRMSTDAPWDFRQVHCWSTVRLILSLVIRSGWASMVSLIATAISCSIFADF